MVHCFVVWISKIYFKQCFYFLSLYPTTEPKAWKHCKETPYSSKVLIRSEIQKNISKNTCTFFSSTLKHRRNQVSVLRPEFWLCQGSPFENIDVQMLVWLPLEEEDAHNWTSAIHMISYALAMFMRCPASEPLPVCLHWRMVKFTVRKLQQEVVLALPTETLYVGLRVPHRATDEGKQAAWKVCPFCMQQVNWSFHGTWTHPQNSSRERYAVETCRDSTEKSISFLMVSPRENKPCLANSRNVNQYCSLTGQAASWEANQTTFLCSHLQWHKVVLLLAEHDIWNCSAEAVDPFCVVKIDVQKTWDGTVCKLRW